MKNILDGTEEEISEYLAEKRPNPNEIKSEKPLTKIELGEWDKIIDETLDLVDKN